MPTRVSTAARPTDILLVSGDWRLRVPLRAQLGEDGYEVTALETWDEAELLLRVRALAPRIVIVDVQEEANPEAVLRTLAGLAADRSVLVLTAPSALPPSAVRALGFDAVLTRPFRIRDVEAVVARWLPRGATRSG
jgi:DNA-binding response OmpR family regulator